jgi:hypothetical protein
MNIRAVLGLARQGSPTTVDWVGEERFPATQKVKRSF